MPKSKKQVILGIDPGLADTGFGIIAKEGGCLKLIDYGVVKTKAGKPAKDRLSEIYQSLEKIIKKYQPDSVSIEQLFFCKNVKTALSVGQARGVIVLLAGQNNIPLKEFTPLQVKMGTTGYGKASKNQVQQMVKIILKLKELPKPDDAADALAIAICNAHTN